MYDLKKDSDEVVHQLLYHKIAYFGISSSSPLNSLILFSLSILTWVHFAKSTLRVALNRITWYFFFTFFGTRILNSCTEAELPYKLN